MKWIWPHLSTIILVTLAVQRRPRIFLEQLFSSCDRDDGGSGAFHYFLTCIGGDRDSFAIAALLEDSLVCLIGVLT